ncbi:hypothetical protein H1R20_g11537, partial [Candolleomyces eurysporus]
MHRINVLAVAVAGRNHHDPNAIEEFDAAMEGIVGSGKGGLTDFEREKGAKKINGNRCFSLATTYEKMKKLAAPAAAGKKSARNLKAIL